MICIFQIDLCEGQEADFPQVSGSVLKVSEKLLRPDDLWAYFDFHLVFSYWKS